MVQTIMRREYHIVCDGCGHTGPPSESPEHAGQLVREDDWQSANPVPGFPFLTTWLCAACHHHREVYAERLSA